MAGRPARRRRRPGATRRPRSSRSTIGADLGPREELLDHDAPETVVDLEGLAQLLARRATREPAPVEPAERAQHRRDVARLELLQDDRRDLEQRREQRIGDRRGREVAGAGPLVPHGDTRGDARAASYTARVQAAYEDLRIDTRGDGDVIDVTPEAQKAIDATGLHDGLCTVFVAHSTCGVTTIECEPGCNADLNDGARRRRARGRAAGSTTSATPTPTGTATSGPR